MGNHKPALDVICKLAAHMPGVFAGNVCSLGVQSLLMMPLSFLVGVCSQLAINVPTVGSWLQMSPITESCMVLIMFEDHTWQPLSDQ